MEAGGCEHFASGCYAAEPSWELNVGPLDHKCNVLLTVPVINSMPSRLCACLFEAFTYSVNADPDSPSELQSRAGLQSASTSKYQASTTRIKFGKRGFSYAAGPSACS